MTADTARSLYALSTAPLDVCDGEWAHRVRNVLMQLGYLYVSPFDRKIATFLGAVHVPRGLLSDGASGGAPDHDSAAEHWWAHDRLYLSPWIQRGERRIRVSRRQADLIYAVKLMRSWHPIEAAVSYIALRAAGDLAWDRYRTLEQELGPDMLFALHCLPHRDLWEIGGFRIEQLRFHRR